MVDEICWLCERAMVTVRAGGPLLLRLAGIFPILVFFAVVDGRRFSTFEEETATGDVFIDVDVPGRFTGVAPLGSAFCQLST
jgi:hypothetical protein